MALVFLDQDPEMTSYLTPASTYPRMTLSQPRLDLPSVIKKKILRPVILAILWPKRLNKDRTGIIEYWNSLDILSNNLYCKTFYLLCFILTDSSKDQLITDFSYQNFLFVQIARDT